MNNEEYVYTDLQIKLVKKLRTVFDNDNFILGVICDVWESPEDQKTVIDFIDAGNDVDMETVCVLAMDLRDARNVND